MTKELETPLDKLVDILITRPCTQKDLLGKVTRSRRRFRYNWSRSDRHLNNFMRKINVRI